MTVRLRHAPADLGRVRFAVSPVWETNAAVRLLARGRAGSPHGRWAAQARHRAAGLDLVGLVSVMPRTGYTPDFLAPPPAGPGTTFEQELAGIRATPVDQVRKELAESLGPDPDLPMGAQWLTGEPVEALARLADALARAWEALVLPAWAATREVLEADIAVHSRRSTLEGVGAMLDGLDHRVSWTDDRTLSVDNGVEAERDLGGEGLVLMPSSFVWPDVVVVTDPPWRATLVYPARGVADLWSSYRGADRTTALAALLGARRAALLEALGTASTTSRLARSMAMSPAAVSGHLGVLRRAGLVTRARVGRSVEYRRTSLGDALVRE